MPVELMTHKVVDVTFPARLAAARKLKGFTQETLGDKAGLTKLQIYRYERGTSQPTLEALKNIAMALNMSIDTLAFDNAERLPKDELMLLFEGVSRLDDNEQALIKELIQSIMLKHDAKRYFEKVGN